MALELAENDFAIGADDVVGDEGFHAEFADGDIGTGGEAVVGGDDEDEPVGIDDRGDEAFVTGVEGDEAEFEVAIDELGGDLAREAAANLNFDFRVLGAVELDVAEEVEGSRLVGADREAAGGVIAEFSEGVEHFAFEVFKAAGKFEDDLAGVGEEEFLGAAVD